MFGGRHMKVELATGDPGYETDRRVFPAAIVQRMGGLETFIGLLSDPALEPLFARLGAFALVDATGRVRASTTSYREVAGETVLPPPSPPSPTPSPPAAGAACGATASGSAPTAGTSASRSFRSRAWPASSSRT